MIDLYYKSYGQGTPVIILHGLFGMSDNWQTIAKQLADHYWVFLIDQRNHGRSPHADVFDYKAMSEDLHQFMVQHWIHQAIVIGHSMGGKTAMQFAIDYPDMVEKLIVVDIAPKAYEGGHQTIFEALFSVNLNGHRERSEVEAVLARKISDRGVRLFLMKNLTRTKEGGFRWKINLESIYKNYQKILANIEATELCEVPTLFVRGGRSNYVDQAAMDIIPQYFSDSEIKTIETAGHWVHADAPQELLEIIHSYSDKNL